MKIFSKCQINICQTIAQKTGPTKCFVVKGFYYPKRSLLVLLPEIF